MWRPFPMTPSAQILNAAVPSRNDCHVLACLKKYSVKENHQAGNVVVQYKENFRRSNNISREDFFVCSSGHGVVEAGPLSHLCACAWRFCRAPQEGKDRHGNVHASVLVCVFLSAHVYIYQITSAFTFKIL